MASLRRLFTRRGTPPAAPVAEPEAPPAPPLASPVLAKPEREPPPAPEHEVGPASRRRHGSQRRQRTRAVTVPCTPDEHAALLMKAAAAGLSGGGFLRQCGLGAPTPRTPRRSTFNEAQRAEVMSALNRTGNNLNQIARALNRGDTVLAEAITAALRQYAGAVNLLMHAATGAANDR